MTLAQKQIASQMSPEKAQRLISPPLPIGAACPGHRLESQSEVQVEVHSANNTSMLAKFSQDDTTMADAPGPVDGLSAQLAVMKSPSKRTTAHFQENGPDVDGNRNRSGAIAFPGFSDACFGVSAVSGGASALVKEPKPIVKGLQPANHLYQPSSSTSMIVSPGEVQLGNKMVLQEELQATMKLQRASNNWWKGSWAFPAQNHHRGYDSCEPTSCEVAPHFICFGIHGCRVGDCASNLTGAQILVIRQRILRELAFSTGGKSSNDVSMRTHLTQRLLPYYNPGSEVWSPVPLNIGLSAQTTLCPAAYCLVFGVPGATAMNIITDVTKGTPLIPDSDLHTTGRQVLEVASLAEGLLTGYILSMLLKFEANPTPGAARNAETNMMSKPWPAKWKACQDYFRNANPNQKPPGTFKQFKRLWKAQKRIVELKVLTHAKCTICSLISNSMI